MFEYSPFPDFEFEAPAHQRRYERLRGMQDPKRVAGPKSKIWSLIERAESDGGRFIMPDDDETFEMLKRPERKNYQLIDPLQSPESW